MFTLQYNSMSNFFTPDVHVQDTEAWLDHIIKDLEKLEKESSTMPNESIQMCESFLRHGVFLENLSKSERTRIANKAMAVVHRLGQIGHNEKSSLVISFMGIVNDSKNKPEEDMEGVVEETRDQLRADMGIQVFIDSICNSALPHLEELKRDGKQLDDSGSLRELINMIIESEFPKIEELDERQLEAIYYAIPKIIKILSRMDIDFASVVKLKIHEFSR